MGLFATRKYAYGITTRVSKVIVHTSNLKNNGFLNPKKPEISVLKNNITNQEATLDVTGFFLAIGHNPNTNIFNGQLNMDEVGYLITKPDSSLTDKPGVFASGDAQDSIYRQAITAAGSGCMAALDAEKYLSDLN